MFRPLHQQRPHRRNPVSGLVWPAASVLTGLLALDFALLCASSAVRAAWLLPMSALGIALGLSLFAVLGLALRRSSRDLAQSQDQAQSFFGRDPLSRLPNRLLFTERLDVEVHRLGRTDGGIAVLFLDLDRFKDVNDTFGHQAGDELIKQVAERLGDLLRGVDTLARFGGDEFAIIQTGVRSPADVEALAR